MVDIDETLRLRLAARTMIEWGILPSSPEYGRVLEELIKIFQKSYEGSSRPNIEILRLDSNGTFLWFLSGQIKKGNRELREMKLSNRNNIANDQRTIEQGVDGLVKELLKSSTKWRPLKSHENERRQNIAVIFEGLGSNDDGVQEAAMRCLVAYILPHNEKLRKHSIDRLDGIIRLVEKSSVVRLDGWVDTVELALGLVIIMGTLGALAYMMFRID